MKISKLFHWLYAFLMLLPIAFLIPNLFYYAFNEHAVNSYKETPTVNYKYETNDTSNGLVQNNIYYFSSDEYIPIIDLFTFGNENVYGYVELFVLDGEFNFSFPFDVDEYILTPLNLSKPYFDLEIICDDIERNQYSILGYFGVENDGDFYTAIYADENYQDCLITGWFTFVYSYYYNVSNSSSYINQCPIEYIPIESVDINVEDNSIVGSINDNIHRTFDLPMFSWTKNNFIVQPFNYVTSMFGLTNDNVVSYYLDYWVSISVIYLVFDLVMYLPLLCHRWIDKGMVE